MRPLEPPRRRFLVVTEFYPVDPDRDVFGVYQRLERFLRVLSGLGEVEILYFVSPGVASDPGAAEARHRRLRERWGLPASIRLCPVGKPDRPARALGRGAVSAYHQRLELRTAGPEPVAAFEEALERAPDAVFAFRLGAMAPLLLRSRPPGVPVLFDLDDVEHRKLLRAARHDRAWASTGWLGAPALAWSVRRAVRLADRTFVSSAADVGRVRRLAGVDRVRHAPNAVTVPDPVTDPTGSTLLFLGTYRYRPNVEAAEWLIRHVWPRVRAEVPDARLVLAGPDPERIPGAGPEPGTAPSGDAPPDGVEFPGFVEDLAALYRRTRVVCCPIRLGGGTRIKILEAAAHGRPVVATRFGAAGLGLDDGRHLLLRESPADFAAACVRLLRDDARAAALGAAARAEVAGRYGRDVVEPRIRRLVLEAVDPPPAMAHTGTVETPTLAGDRR